MAERFTADLAFIIIALLGSALIGVALGYYIRKSIRCKRCAELEADNNSLRQMVASLETDKLSLNQKIEKLEGEGAEMRTRIARLEAEAAAAAAKRRAPRPKKAKAPAANQ